MDINALNANLNRDKWGVRNFRALKSLLVKEVQESLSEFMPLTSSSYYNNPIQVLDFFSGAGGTSLGFAALNTVIPTFKMLGGCDINQISAQTYSRNFDTPVIHEDIVRLANEEGALETLLESIGFDTNKPTILIGCAPCQGFSSHRKRHWDEEDDVRNSLVMAFATIVGKIMPDVIVMENVPEFLSQKYWRYFSAAKKSYQQLGYTVKEHIYNAAAFGVPQDRFRTIVIGMKKEFLLPEGYLTPNEYRTVRDAISKLPPVAAGVADPNDPMHKSAAHKQSTIDVIRQVPHDGGSRPEGVGPECLDRVRGFYDVYGRLYWDKPSITITHYARNPASGRYTHPEQDRGLTAREAALLQSFPNGFEFTGKSDDIYRQIGEAVPPLLSSAIAANILIELLSTEPTADELSASPQSIDEPVSSSFSSVIAGIKMKDQAAKATKYTCIDSFCGAGGLGLGLKRAGFNILLSFDIDQICIDTIKANKKYFNHPAEAADIADMLNGELCVKYIQDATSVQRQCNANNQKSNVQAKRYFGKLLFRILFLHRANQDISSKNSRYYDKDAVDRTHDSSENGGDDDRADNCGQLIHNDGKESRVTNGTIDRVAVRANKSRHQCKRDHDKEREELSKLCSLCVLSGADTSKNILIGSHTENNRQSHSKKACGCHAAEVQRARRCRTGCLSRLDSTDGIITEENTDSQKKSEGNNGSLYHAGCISAPKAGKLRIDEHNYGDGDYAGNAGHTKRFEESFSGHELTGKQANRRNCCTDVVDHAGDFAMIPFASIVCKGIIVMLIDKIAEEHRHKSRYSTGEAIGRASKSRGRATTCAANDKTVTNISSDCTSHQEKDTAGSTHGKIPVKGGRIAAAIPPDAEHRYKINRNNNDDRSQHSDFLSFLHHAEAQ